MHGLFCAACRDRPEDREREVCWRSRSHSLEFLVPDGKAIQGPDWHYDGQNFAKAFDIMFLDKDEKKK